VVYKKGSQNVVADALSRLTGEINTNSVLALTNSATPNAIPISNKPLNEFNIQII